MKITAIEIKPGMIIEHKNDFWNVLKTQHVKPGKGGAFNQVELKSVIKGTKLNERFRSNETVEKAELNEKKFNFLYLDGDNCHFMDNETFEQVEIPKSIAGEQYKLLKENLEVVIAFMEEKPISLKLPNNIIQIDIDPEAENRTYKTNLFHCGDGKLVLGELYNRLSKKIVVDNDWINEVSELKNKIIQDYKKNLGAYKDFPEIIRRVLPENGRWVRDVTISNSMWGNRSMLINKPEQNIYPVGAAIGPGMALAIGAAIASEGKKTIAMCGDGGFMLNLPDLWTASETNCDVVFLVMNDNGYGVIKHIQDSMYGGRKFFADLMGPNFEDLAKVAKMKYKKIDYAKDLEKVLKEAVNFDGPVLVEVNVASVGEMPRYFAPPPHALKK